MSLIKRYLPFFLFSVFIFWMLPEILSNHLSPESTSSRIVVERHFLGFSINRSSYDRNQLEAIGVRYHKAYFDFKMRGIYHVGLIFRGGRFVVLKQLNTTLQNEISLPYAADIQIKHNQALATARKIAAQLN